MRTAAPVLIAIAICVGMAYMLVRTGPLSKFVGADLDKPVNKGEENNQMAQLKFGDFQDQNCFDVKPVLLASFNPKAEMNVNVPELKHKILIGDLYKNIQAEPSADKKVHLSVLFNFKNNLQSKVRSLQTISKGYSIHSRWIHEHHGTLILNKKQIGFPSGTIKCHLQRDARH